MIGLLGFSALTIDFGVLWVARAQAQNAADAARARRRACRWPTSIAATPTRPGRPPRPLRPAHQVWGEPGEHRRRHQSRPAPARPVRRRCRATCIRVDVHRTQARRQSAADLLRAAGRRAEPAESARPRPRRSLIGNATNCLGPGDSRSLDDVRAIRGHHWRWRRLRRALCRCRSDADDRPHPRIGAPGWRSRLQPAATRPRWSASVRADGQRVLHPACTSARRPVRRTSSAIETTSRRATACRSTIGDVCRATSTPSVPVDHRPASNALIDADPGAFWNPATGDTSAAIHASPRVRPSADDRARRSRTSSVQTRPSPGHDAQSGSQHHRVFRRTRRSGDELRLVGGCSPTRRALSAASAYHGRPRIRRSCDRGPW